MKALLLALALVFAAPQSEDAATVYFYRLEEAPRMIRGKPKLRIDGKVFATFPEREFIGVRMKPGRYVFALGQPQSATAFHVKAGETYFVQVSYTAGGRGYNGLLDQIFVREPLQAELHFEQIKSSVEDKNIKDKALALVRERPTFPQVK